MNRCLSGAALFLASAGCVDADMPLRVDRAVPGSVLETLDADVVIEGRFPRDASASLDDGSVSHGGGDWEVRIADRVFRTPDVEWLDAERIAVRLSPGLDKGSHDVTVAAPWGQEATARRALRVTSLKSVAEISLETAPGGEGEPIAERTLTTDELLAVHAIARDDLGTFLGNLPAIEWNVTGGIGEIAGAEAASSSTFDPRTVGEGRVRALFDGLPPAETGRLTIVPGRVTSFGVDPSSLVIAIGNDPFTLEITDALDADGNPTSDVGQVTWEIASGPIAMIDADTGVFTPQAAGAGTVRAVSSWGPSAESGAIVVILGTGNMPRACFTVGATAGTAGVTSFPFDASCSSDPDESDAVLSVRWDLDGDGVFDTPFSVTKTASTTYPGTGTRTVAVEVRDSTGRTDATAHLVDVHGGDAVVVTTHLDENDTGARPGAPGGAGLSLREAITWVNAIGEGRTITFASTAEIELSSVLPALTAPGAAIVGRPGLRLDMEAAGGAGVPCMALGGTDQRLLWLRIEDCRGTFLDVEGARNRIAESILVGRPDGANGVQLKGTGGVVGPHNDISQMPNKGVTVKAANNTVEASSLHHNGLGIDTSGLSGSVVRRNRIWLNAGAGIQIANGETGAVVVHNVVHGNGGTAIAVGTGVTALDLRNNVLTDNDGWGVSAPDASAFAIREPNAFHANDVGALSFATPGPSSVLADPRFLDTSSGNFRLRRDSPCVDAGADTGLDVNGAAAGSFHSLAPDLGAHESTY